MARYSQRIPADYSTIDSSAGLTGGTDLSRNAGDIEPQAWHADVLAAREAALERGQEEFEDWQQAREEISKATR